MRGVAGFPSPTCVGRVLRRVARVRWRGDDGAVVIDAIMLLEPGERSVIVMRLLRGCSFREIACALEVSEPAAKMRFQRALAVLRRSSSSRRRLRDGERASRLDREVRELLRDHPELIARRRVDRLAAARGDF